MRLALVVLGLVAACRFRFDERGDAGTTDRDGSPDVFIPAGHDEDGDGVPDVSDTCPHLATAPQLDTDGDGVGDTCDFSSLPNQTIALFDPLVSGSGFTVVSATWNETGESFHSDTTSTFGELKRPFPFREGVIWLGADILSRAPAAPQYQVSLSVYDQVTQPFYYVEVFQGMADTGYGAISQYDGSQYMPIAMQPMASGIQTGRLTLRFNTLPPTPTVGFSVDQPGEAFGGNIQAAGYAGGGNIGVGVQGLVVDLAYILVIATRP